MRMLQQVWARLADQPVRVGIFMCI